MAASRCYCLVLLGSLSWFLIATPLELNGVELAARLKDISEKGLGRSKIQELLNEKATFTTKVPTGHDIVRKLAASVGNSFMHYSDAVKKLHHRLIEVIGDLTTLEGYENVTECCKLTPPEITVPWCFRHYSGSAGQQVTYHKNILETMGENAKAIPNLGWQYYGNEEGQLIIYPPTPEPSCTTFDLRLRPWYAEASAPIPKDIVIAMETSTQMDTSLIRNAVDILLDTMNPNDRITVLKFGRDVNSYLGSSDHSTCFSQDLALATPQNSRIFRAFIKSKEGNPHGPAKLLPVITKSFDYFRKASDTTERRKLLVIFTASDPVDIKDHTELIREIAAQNTALQRKVTIQMYAFGSNMSNDTKDALQKIAESTSFETSTGRVQTGTFTHIKLGNQLRLQLHSYYSIFADSVKTSEPIVTVPYYDFSGLGLVISLCLPLHLGIKLQGVTCVDAELEDIFFNVTYYHQGIDAYGFIIDSRGRTILHPLLPKPTDSQEDPKFVNILSLEMDQGVDEVIQSMTSGGNGSRRFHASRTQVRLGVPTGSHHLVSEYFWTKVPDTDYSLCMVFTNRDREVEVEPKWEKQQDEKRPPRVNYIHPYTIIHGENELRKRCLHDGQAATTDGSVVMFSGAAYKFLSGGVNPENITQLQSYDNFFKGSAYDQAPAFKKSTQGWVALSGLIDNIWTVKPSTDYDLQIVWRHFVTASGVIRQYPGVNYTQYNPSSFSWYKQAILSEGWIQLHPVEKQNSFNVMISQAIQSSPDVIPVAVVGGEMRPTILYHILQDVYPACRSARCFIVDGNGYILAHKRYTKRDVRPAHISQLEPAIARYLIDNGHLVEALCLDFLSQYRTLVNWKMAIKDGYVSPSPGSPRFELHAILNTNVLVGITWDNDVKSCDCQNFTQCIQNNQGTCRCPCFETLKFNLCNNTLPDRGHNGPSACSILRNNFDTMQQNYLPKSEISQLEPCFMSPCDQIPAESSCYKMSGCQWCPLDGESAPSCHDGFFCGQPVSPITGENGLHVTVPIILCLLVLILIVAFCCAVKYSPGMRRKLCVKKYLERNQETPTPIYEVPNEGKVFGKDFDDLGMASLYSNDPPAIFVVNIPKPETRTDILAAIPPPPDRCPLPPRDSALSSDNAQLDSQGHKELTRKSEYHQNIKPPLPPTLCPSFCSHTEAEQGTLVEGYDTSTLNESQEDQTENIYVNKSADTTFTTCDYDLSISGLFNNTGRMNQEGSSQNEADLGNNQAHSAPSCLDAEHDAAPGFDDAEHNNPASNNDNFGHNGILISNRDSGVMVSDGNSRGSSQTYLKGAY